MADEYGGVIPELKMKDFKNVDGKFKIIHPKMKGKRGGLVVFYHYWCGYCQQLSPEFKKLGVKVNRKFMIGAVHGSDVKNSNHLLFETMGMSAVPDIRFVDKRGYVSQEQYTGQRTVEAFTDYITEKVRTIERAARKDDVDKAIRLGIIKKGLKKGGAKKRVVKKKLVKKVKRKIIKKRVVKKKPVKKVKKKTIKKRVVKKKPVKKVKKRFVKKVKKIVRKNKNKK